MTDGNITRHVKLTFVRSDGLTQPLTINSGESVLVGRDLICDVRLDGRKVSRRHMRLSFRPDGRVLCQDNTSHNGTYINGHRIMEKVLAGGEIITVGEWEGRLDIMAGAARRDTAPGMMPAIELARTNNNVENDFDDPTENAPITSIKARVSTPQGIRALSASVLVDGDVGNEPNDFERSTDPNMLREPLAPHPLAAKDFPTGLSLRPPPGAGDSASQAPSASSDVDFDTRIVDMRNVWHWDDSDRSSEVSGDILRARKVQENPIVQRLTQSSLNLDFRGIGGLGAKSRTKTPGDQPFNVDEVALQLVFQVTEALASATSMDDFLGEMVQKLFAAARAKAVVVLLPDDNGNLVPRIVKNRRADESVHLSRTVIEHAIASRAAVTTEDAAADARFSSGESVLRFDLKAVLAVPLTRDKDVLGAVYITRDLPFTDTERDLVAALSHLIAMGLERSKLREQIAHEEHRRRTLERFHAPDVVRRLMMQDEQSRGQGLFLETLDATILFCDLSGFTRFCEGNDAETVGRLLNLYLGAMTEIVFSFGGTVDKYIGDAIMCIFGAPFNAPDDALRAVQCAAEMRNQFRAMMDRGDAGELGQAMQVHLGVNTGPVVAGTVGSSLRMEYTALGDTVNIAARLEGVARAGEIIIGEATANLVAGSIPLLPRGKISLKGRDEPVAIFEVPRDISDEPTGLQPTDKSHTDRDADASSAN